MFLRNISNDLPDYIASYHRRLHSSFSDLSMHEYKKVNLLKEQSMLLMLIKIRR
jgi:hypothetical protein